MRFQNETSKRGGTRYLPYTFTELRVAMLSSVLNSSKAIQMNITIMRAFGALKEFALNYKELAEKINELREKIDVHDVQLNQIYDAIEGLLDDKIEQKSWKDRERIGFKK